MAYTLDNNVMILLCHALVGEYHAASKLKLMVTNLHSGEGSHQNFYHAIHDVGCQVYDIVNQYEESDEVVELCFTFWQHLHCFLFQGILYFRVIKRMRLYPHRKKCAASISRCGIIWNIQRLHRLCL